MALFSNHQNILIYVISTFRVMAIE